jgi:rhodanese-related sulfurtransferase
MRSSIGVLLASFLLLSACADREQHSPSAADRRAAASGEASTVAPGAPQSRPIEPAHPVDQPVGQDQPLYLDVRTQAEYDAGHVAGTMHIPLDQLAQRWQELATFRDRPMVVYCRTGRRSAAAIDLLRNRGFERLENGGGVTHMAARGLPMEPQHCC